MTEAFVHADKKEAQQPEWIELYLEYHNQ